MVQPFKYIECKIFVHTKKKERKKKRYIYIHRERERGGTSKEGKLFVQKLIILILMGVLAGLQKSNFLHKKTLYLGNTVTM
jgi:hypothetical protein